LGKISSEARKIYTERIKEYKAVIETIHIREKKVLGEINKDSERAGYQKIGLADEMLNVVSYFLLMNKVSTELLGLRNEEILNNARKSCYKAIIYLEQVVTDYIDVSFSEYEEQLERIADFSDEGRWKLIQKLGFSIDAVKLEYGENTKWKWSFVELEGRFGTISKNILNLRKVIAGMDPRIEGYETRYAHLHLTLTLLQSAADRYREKYELSTNRLDDFKLAIKYLSSLRRLYVLMGETSESEIIKKKIDIWKTKMESDQHRKDLASRKR